MRPRRPLSPLTLAVAVTVGLGATVTGAGTATARPLPAAAGRVDAPAAATAAAPDITFSVPSGTFTGTVDVELATSLGEVALHYTVDGSVPTAASPSYDGHPVHLSRSTQLRAQAFDPQGAPVGRPAASVHVARAVQASHDLPVLVLDDYGRGKPTKTTEYPLAVLQFPAAESGADSLGQAPTLATRATFHLRGQSSANFPKAPYKLDLRGPDDKRAQLPLGGLAADSGWVLRGPYADKSLIRDALVTDLSRELGMKASRFTLVEVYLNLDANPVAANDYQGVYVLIEPVDNGPHRLGLAELDPQDDAEPEISGGYAFKFDWRAAEEPTLTCTGPATTCWHYLEVVEPSSPTDAQKAWLTAYLQRFHDALHSDHAADPQTGYPAYLDVDSCVDMVVLSELLRGQDSYVRSQYFTKDRGGKLTCGPMWDSDLTFGQGGSFHNTDLEGWQYQQLSTRTPIATDWWGLLMADPGFAAKVAARWRQLRTGALSDAALRARAERLAAPLAAAAGRNFAKWPVLTTRRISGFTTSTDPTWAGQIESLLGWASRRSAWLDSSAGWGGTAAAG